MATIFYKSFLASFVISLFILNLVRIDHAHPTVNGNDSGGNIDCGEACGERCKLSSRKKICLRGCGTCCERCHCVPPGTSGHADVCPCYANMTTHGGKRKCP
ncbi:hypothetical protein V2J09_023909 [Rumex salicifolius]